jgi:hypothetical protein
VLGVNADCVMAAAKAPVVGEHNIWRSISDEDCGIVDISRGASSSPSSKYSHSHQNHPLISSN